MTECVLHSRKEIAETVKQSYYACVRGDWRCYSECPYLEECWNVDSKPESQKP